MRFQNIDDFMKFHKLRQKELGRLLGVSESGISLLLAGKRRPSFELAMRIKALTGIPLEQSLSGNLAGNK